MIKKQEQKVKPELKIADEFLDLRTIDTSVIVEHLEEQIKLREMGIEKQFGRKLKKI